jgi:sulfide:quinone oxidoreductase
LSTKNNVVILGCGVGGLVAAGELARKTRRQASITLIERKQTVHFPPSFPWVMMGWRQPKQVQRNFSFLSKKGIKLVKDTVKSIDTRKKRVGTEASSLEYDHLVVALGAEYAPESIPGFIEHAHHIYDLESAVKFREAVQNFQGGNVLIGVSKTPFKCPTAPYEAALLLEEQFRREKKNFKIQFFTPEKQPVPTAGPVLGKQVEKMLVSRGIEYHPKKELVEVKQDRVLFKDGEEMSFNLLMAVPPHRCPKPVIDAEMTDASGWVAVNSQTLATKFNDVYAVGDVTAIETPHGHMPFLPKAGVFAEAQAEVVANNLAYAITGKGERKAWDGSGYCFLGVSKSESAFLKGSFLSNPPRLEFHPPRRKWYLDKVAFEKNWMKRRF